MRIHFKVGQRVCLHLEPDQPEGTIMALGVDKAQVHADKSDLVYEVFLEAIRPLDEKYIDYDRLPH